MRTAWVIRKLWDRKGDRCPSPRPEPAAIHDYPPLGDYPRVIGRKGSEAYLRVAGDTTKWPKHARRSILSVGAAWQQPWTFEEIAAKIEHLTLEQIHAALACYHAIRDEIDSEVENEEAVAGEISRASKLM